MTIHEISFLSRAAAKTFAAGVEFVNDSALVVKGIKKTRGKKEWTVVIEDKDHHPEDDDE